MYIKYANYQPDMQLGDDDSVLMSLQEFLGGGKDLEDVPVTITPDGNPPTDIDDVEEEIDEKTEDLIDEIPKTLEASDNSSPKINDITIM